MVAIFIGVAAVGYLSVLKYVLKNVSPSPYTK